MCGVYGFSFADDRQASPITRAVLSSALGKNNQSRGSHSWGVALVSSDGIRVYKDVGPIVSCPEALQCGVTTLNMFGHTRYATHGAKSAENAHPFTIGRVTGMHNGVIYNHIELNKKFDRKFEVDSMHIFAHLDEGKPLTDLEGYGTAIWYYSDQPGRIYFARLSDRGELTVYGIGRGKKDPEGVILSSSEGHLKDALQTAGLVDTFEFNIVTGSIYFIENGMLYRTEEKAKITEAMGRSWSDYGTTSGSGKKRGRTYFTRGSDLYGDEDDVTPGGVCGASSKPIVTGAGDETVDDSEWDYKGTGLTKAEFDNLCTKMAAKDVFLLCGLEPPVEEASATVGKE